MLYIHTHGILQQPKSSAFWPRSSATKLHFACRREEPALPRERADAGDLGRFLGWSYRRLLGPLPKTDQQTLRASGNGGSLYLEAPLNWHLLIPGLVTLLVGFLSGLTYSTLILNGAMSHEFVAYKYLLRALMLQVGDCMRTDKGIHFRVPTKHWRQAKATAPGVRWLQITGSSGLRAPHEREEPL